MLKKIIIWSIAVYLIFGAIVLLWAFFDNAAGPSAMPLLFIGLAFLGIGGGLAARQLSAAKKKTRADAERAQQEHLALLNQPSTNDASSAAPSRAIVRVAVEEMWTQSLNYSARGQAGPAAQVLLDFNAKIERQAGSMSEEQRASFLAIVEEERERVIAEFDLAPDALKKRLGVTSRGPMPTPNRQGMGEMVVRTAVRASIWAIIWDIFR